MLLSIVAFYFTFKSIKGIGGRIVLSLVNIVTTIIVLVIGVTVLGVSELGKAVGEEVRKQESANALKEPKNSAGEAKENFAITEVVTGNGFEIKVNSLGKFTDGLSSEFFTKTEYCTANLTIKNLLDSKTVVDSITVQFLGADNNIIYPNSFFLDDDKEKEYELKSYELEKDQEATFNVAAECSLNPIFLVIKDYGINLVGEQPKDIKFNVDYSQVVG